MDAFTKAYIEAALWSSTDESTPQGGEPLDANYDITDIAPEALARMQADCAAFQAVNEADIYDYDAGKNAELAGHDFWLTRNHHGAGFWDGDWQEEIGKRLTASAHAFGECNLYIGDDGKVYAA
jgi:hypothetical protein